MTDSRFERQILLIKQGDKQGLKEIYDEYGKMIYSVMMSMVGSCHNAEDLTSDFFLKLWEKLADTFCAGNGHKRWLVTVAKNMALDFLRKRNHEELSVDCSSEDDSTIKEPVDSVNTENTVIGNISVQNAMQSLENEEKEIINLKLFAGLTFINIASSLGKPLGTVTWKYHNALKKMKKYLKEVQNDEYQKAL